jgi:hypothetical protein
MRAEHQQPKGARDVLGAAAGCRTLAFMLLLLRRRRRRRRRRSRRRKKNAWWRRRRFVGLVGVSKRRVLACLWRSDVGSVPHENKDLEAELDRPSFSFENDRHGVHHTISSNNASHIVSHSGMWRHQDTL